MIRSAVTVSIVEQARKGPFVFHDDVEAACQKASELGFDAIELFAPSGDVIRALPLSKLLREYGLSLAAVGTGAGMVVHQLSLSSPDAAQRAKAMEFVRSIMAAGAEFGAPAIIGSMQGRWDDVTGREAGVGRLRDSLSDLGLYAAQLGGQLIYEPLNRYETNMAMTMEQGVELLKPLSSSSVRLLADLFHMNIEERSIADGIRSAGQWLGHVHFVDSNRQAAGRGHMNYAPIVSALREIGYDGYASAEAFPIPDSLTTARQTIETFRSVFR